MTSSTLSLAFASCRRASVRASLPAAMHRGWGAGIGMRSVGDLIL